MGHPVNRSSVEAYDGFEGAGVFLDGEVVLPEVGALVEDLAADEDNSCSVPAKTGLSETTILRFNAHKPSCGDCDES